MTRPGIVVEGLSLSIGDFHLDELGFSISSGEILVILGPNGSGKSVTLETIAGFHRPDAGRILIGERDVTNLPPERRNVAFLVQNFGLFPHLTVEQNVAIALRGEHAGADRDVTSLPHRDVPGLLDYFGVAHLARRTPHALSSGEKQRVALARALAAEPEGFLFDEPFAALDAHTCEQLREELLSFLHRLSIPAIFVTHDHTDAMILADRIVVLRGGRTMQAGPAEEILHRPASAFVARFVGIENVLAGRLDATGDGLATFVTGDGSLRAVAPAHPPEAPHDVRASIRAESVVLHPPGAECRTAPEVNRLDARVTDVRVLGALATVHLACGFPLKACVSAREAHALGLAPGCDVQVEIDAASIHLMAD